MTRISILKPQFVLKFLYKSSKFDIRHVKTPNSDSFFRLKLTYPLFYKEIAFAPDSPTQFSRIDFPVIMEQP